MFEVATRLINLRSKEISTELTLPIVVSLGIRGGAFQERQCFFAASTVD
jgi:hypothetical protein